MAVALMAAERPRSTSRHAGTPRPGAGLPLSMARAGDAVTVTRVRGREDFTRHLAELGFVPGAVVEVVSQGASGTIVRVKGCQLGLDRDTAKRISTQ